MKCITNTMLAGKRNEVMMSQALNRVGTGCFTKDADNNHTTKEFKKVEFNSNTKVIHAHLDVDSEYQSYSRGKSDSRKIVPSVVSVKDWVTGDEFLFDCGTDFSKWFYVWDKVFSTQTFRYTDGKRRKNIGKVVLNLYYFWADNDLRFLAHNYQEYNGFINDLSQVLKKTRIVSVAKESKHSKYVELKGYYMCDLETGLLRQLCFRVFDCSGMLGVGSLKSYASSLGIEMSSKSLLDAHKHHMNDVWEGKYGDIIKSTMGVYSLGDLVCRKMLNVANTTVSDQLKKDLGLDELVFRMTTGSTVSGLLEDLITQRLERTLQGDYTIPSGCKFSDVYGDVREVETLKDVFLLYNQYSTSNTIKKTSFGVEPSTLRWLAKVDGGRAKNELPQSILNPTMLSDYIVDMDYGGAYASTMCSLNIPFGKPRYYHTTENKIGHTLRQVLKKLGDELVDGLWVMRVSGDNIPYQTLIQSQELPSLSKMYDYESDSDETDNTIINKIDGSLVLYTEEVVHGCLTSDVLGVLKTVCTRSEYKQILDNLVVESLIYYAQSDEVDNPNTVIVKTPNNVTCLEESVNELSYSSGSQTEHTLPNVWYRIPMVDIVMPLLKLRGQYPKKTPLNNMYKLFCNTIYGVLASVFFDVGNVVVANNITSKLRVGAWLLRTSCNTFGSITDGGAFNINYVNLPPSRSSLVGLSCYHNVEVSKKLITETHLSYYLPSTAPLVTHTNEDGSITRLRCTKYNLRQNESGYWYVELVAPNGSHGEYRLTKEEVDELAWEHTRDFFRQLGGTPENIPILYGDRYSKKWDGSSEGLHQHILEYGTGQLVYESKDIYQMFVPHGQCDYILTKCQPNKFTEVVGKSGDGSLITQEIDYSGYNTYPIIKVRGKEVDKKDCIRYSDGKPYKSIFSGITLTDSDGCVVSVPQWVTTKPHPVKDYFYQVMLGVLDNRVLVTDYCVTGVYKMVTLKEYQQKRRDMSIIGDEVLISSRFYSVSSSQFIYCTQKQRNAWCKLESKLLDKTGLKLDGLFRHDLDNPYLLDNTYDLAKSLTVLGDAISLGKMPSEVFKSRMLGEFYKNNQHYQFRETHLV